MLKLLLCVLILASNAFSLERCASLKREVRLAHWRAFGTNFPWQYGVGQLHAESGCRDIISNDGAGSQGVAQITYKLWKKVLDANGITEITSLPNSLRAQAVIMKSVHREGNPLWVTYQIYNGGGWVLKEIKRAGEMDWAKAKRQCEEYRERKLNGEKALDARTNSRFTLKDGTVQEKSNCDINYKYAYDIYTLGGQYGDVKDNPQFRYW